MWGQNVLSILSFPFNESFVDFGGNLGGNGGHIIYKDLSIGHIRWMDAIW